jgi:hypothetical protein
MKTTSVLLLIVSFWVHQSCQSQSIQKDYSKLVENIKIQQDSFALNFQQADTAQQQIIISKARRYLLETITSELLPYWYGTPWDFNGTTRIPRKGKIACGYFVTNVLTDVGFDIPRVKWAQSASEVFIKKLAPNHLKRFTNTSIADVENYLLESGAGLYLVGLDSHTGFITVINNKVRFVHADYYDPEKGVVSEALNSDSPIKFSRYRVIGKLFSDEMIISWIQKKAIR